MRYFQEKVLPENQKIMLVVPNLSLIQQIVSDFTEYSDTDENWNVDDNFHVVYAGQAKTAAQPMTLTTWQSVYKQPPSYFSKYGMIIVDEAHGAEAESIKGILEKATNTPYRFGTTGTIKKCKVHKLVLEGLIGPVHQVITTKSLIDNKKLATIGIHAVNLKYNTEECKHGSKLKYHEEIDFITSHKNRNRFILGLCNVLKGNTLVLTQRVEKHGDVLWKMFQDGLKKPKVPFYVYGGVAADDRESIRKFVIDHSESTIIATYQTFQLGINIPNINNIIFATPSKSQIRVLQSIGRGLRIGEGKSHVDVFDLVDILKHKSKENYAYKHFKIRVPFYMDEKFPVYFTTVDLTNLP